MSYIHGLITEDRYNETELTDWETARAETLLDGEARPVTGFEIHFLRCIARLARPVTPKERALLEAMKDYRKPVQHNFSPEPERDYADVIRRWWENTGQFIDREQAYPALLRKADYDASNSDIILKQQDDSDDD